MNNELHHQAYMKLYIHIIVYILLTRALYTYIHIIVYIIIDKGVVYVLLTGALICDVSADLTVDTAHL